MKTSLKRSIPNGQGDRDPSLKCRIHERAASSLLSQLRLLLCSQIALDGVDEGAGSFAQPHQTKEPILSDTRDNN
jgi:hypothetical protein